MFLGHQRLQHVVSIVTDGARLLCSRRGGVIPPSAVPEGIGAIRAFFIRRPLAVKDPGGAAGWEVTGMEQGAYPLPGGGGGGGSGLRGPVCQGYGRFSEG